MFDHIGDPEKVPHLVAVKWIKKLPLGEARRETGFFGNQNTVCKPTAKRWSYTVERLKKLFGVG